MTPSPNTVSSLTSERDQYRRDFCAMSERCIALAAQLTAMERERDGLRLELAAAKRLQGQYEAEDLRLRGLHASALLEVQSLTGALQAMTVRMAVEQRVVVK